MKRGGKELGGGKEQCLDKVWRDTDGPSGFGVPVPALVVPSRDTAVGAASSPMPQSSFARASAQGAQRCCTIRDVTVENGSFHCCA